MFELQAPIVPTPDTSSLQYVTKGLASMIAQRQYHQKLELAYQKLGQDALIQQQKVDDTRQQLAQLLPLQQAQMRNFDAEANFHNAEAAYTQNVKGKDLQDQQELLGQTTEYNQTTPELMNGKWGTTEGQNILGLQAAKYAAIKGTRMGAKSINDDYVHQRREELNNISTLNTLRKNMDDTAAAGIGKSWMNVPEIAAAPSYLDYDPATNGFKQNNVWGINKGSGDPYLTVQPQRDANQQWLGWKVIPPSEAATAKDTKTVTLPKNLAASYITQRDAFRTRAAGLAGPPPSTVQAFGQQQEAGSRMDLARQALNDPTATAQEKAAAQRILGSGQ